MNPLSATFRVFLVFLLAVPLGEGGICCCLFDASAAGAAESVASVPPAHACCTVAEGVAEDVGAPASSRDSMHTAGTEEGGDCSCPERGEALTSAGSTSGALVVSVFSIGFLPVRSGQVLSSDEPPSPVSLGTPYPPPRVPIYRALAVLLC